MINHLSTNVVEGIANITISSMTWCAGWTTSPPDPQATYWPSGIAGWPFRAIGNPLNDGTWTYTWQNGRQLARMQSVDIDASCVYNENGLRVQKTVNGIVTDYTLHGKNVAHMKMGNDELHFSSMPATNPLWWCTMVCFTAM